MLILETISHETIWGGQRLMLYSDGMCKKIGHLYSLQCESEISNNILNGSYKGRTFNEYFDENKNTFGLGKYSLFPFILALVEANDNLSIQVHPDDKNAKNLEDAPFGKNESWYFLSTPDRGCIFDGCKAKTIEEVKEKTGSDKFESIIDELKVEEGDYVYVEAGTLHALTAGSYIYEIEENSPLTYRLYDFERTDDNGNKRELHLEKAFDSLKIDLKSDTRKYSNKCIEERRYITQLHKNIEGYINESDTLECLTIIQGEFLLEDVLVRTGTTIVLEPKDRIDNYIEIAIMARPK